MADISFATEQSPEAVAAQVRQEQEEAQRKATDEYLATPTADHVQPSVASGALPLPPGFVGYLTGYILQHAIRPVREVAVY